MIRTIVLLLGTALLVTLGAEAQPPQIAHVGSHIRFRARERAETIQAVLRAVSRDSITYGEDCSECTPQTIARTTIANLTIELPPQSRISRATTGALLGTLAGGIAGVAAGANAGAGCHDGPCGAGIIIYTPRAAAGGAIVGALVAWFTTPKRWVAAALPVL